MKSKYILIAIIGVIVFIAIFTNPSIDEHKEAMKNKLNSLLQKNLKQELNEMGEDWGLNLILTKEGIKTKHCERLS